MRARTNLDKYEDMPRDRQIILAANAASVTVINPLETGTYIGHGNSAIPTSTSNENNSNVVTPNTGVISSRKLSSQFVKSAQVSSGK